MRWRAIVNSRSLACLGWAEPRLRELVGGLTADVQFTQYAGHARVLTQQATEADGFILFGGDGTIHEVLQHLDLNRQRLIIIPGGTGNSLAQDLGLYGRRGNSPPMPAPAPERIDLLQVVARTPQGKQFRCVAASTLAVGYPAEATRFANLNLKKTFGKHCYALASVTHLFLRQKQEYRITYDGKPAQNRLLHGLLVNNTRHMGNFLCFRQACRRDGFADVLELQAGLLPQLLHNFSVLTKTYWYDPAPTFPVSRVEVQLPAPALFMADGEIYPEVRQIEITLLPQALQVAGLPLSTAPPLRHAYV